MKHHTHKIGYELPSTRTKRTCGFGVGHRFGTPCNNERSKFDIFYIHLFTNAHLTYPLQINHQSPVLMNWNLILRNLGHPNLEEKSHIFIHLVFLMKPTGKYTCLTQRRVSITICQGQANTRIIIWQWEQRANSIN